MANYLTTSLLDGVSKSTLICARDRLHALRLFRNGAFGKRGADVLRCELLRENVSSAQWSEVRTNESEDDMQSGLPGGTGKAAQPPSAINKVA